MADEALLRLQTISFEGAGSYRDVVDPLNLSGQGRVLLCGPEGAGKSMIPEVMTLILYGKGSPRVRKTGLVESSIVNDTTGYQGTLEFLSGFGAAEREVSITQAFKHKRLKSRYIITIDGMREEPEGKPEQKKMVKRLAPLSYDEWLGVVYLHQGGIHDLLSGTPTEKRQYLTSVFGLDFYDDLLVEAKEELKSLVKLAEGAVSLQQKLVDLEAEVQEQEEILDEVPGGIGEVEAGIEKLSKRLQKLSKDIGKLGAAEKAADRLAELREAADEMSETLGIEGREAADAEVMGLRDTANEARQRIAVDKTALQALKQKASAYKRAKDAEASAKTKLDAAKANLEEHQREVADYPDAETLAEAGRHIATGVALLGDDQSIDIPEDITGSKDAWEEQAKEAHGYEETANKLEKLSTQDVHVCPTCDSDLDPSGLKKTVKKLRKAASKAQFEATDGMLANVSEALGDWQPEVEDLTIGYMAEALDEAEEKLAATEQAEQRAERAAEAYEKAKADLDALDKPKSPQKLSESVSEQEEELLSMEERISEVSDLIDILKESDALLKTLSDVDVDNLKENLSDLTAKSEKTRQRYKKAMAIKTQHDHATATIKALNRQVTKVRDELDEHAENAIKIKHYELTLIPYFNSLRAAKVRSCVSVLEGVLPVYVNAMSSDQYTGAEVKLEISDDLKKVDLMLRPGKSAPWVSAIQASGGQRRRFTLAIIAALREVSPRRANLMFFDEPFADLESEGKLLFINNLVPTLMERCDDLDSLFVIAHDREILEASNDAFDTVWEAQRDVYGSRIVTGRKLALVEGR